MRKFTGYFIVAILGMILSACGGGGGGGSGAPSLPTCAGTANNGEPDITGQPVIYRNAVSPGDFINVKVPVDSETGYVVAVIYSGTYGSYSLAGMEHVNLAKSENQSVTLHIPVNPPFIPEQYHISIAVCSDYDACYLSGAGTAVVYAINDIGAQNMSRNVEYRGVATSESTSTCIADLPVYVATGNSPALKGILDTTFHSTGRVKLDLGGDEYAAATVVQPDDKVLVLGTANSDLVVVRFNADGSRDDSFGNHGLIQLDVSGNTDFAGGMVLDHHGRILITGTGLFAGIVRPFVVRLKSSGQRDSDFGVNGLAVNTLSATVGWVNSIAVDHFERIIIAGTATTASSTSGYDLFFERFLADGNVDTTFNGSGFALREVNSDFPTLSAGTDEVYDIAIDDNDNIVFTGAANINTSTFSAADRVLGRMLANGSPDLAFGSSTPGGVTFCVIGQPCGLIVTSTTATLDGWFGLGRDSYGSILVTGQDSYTQILDRRNSAGGTDVSFSPAILTAAGLSLGTDVLSLPDEKILVGGSTQGAWMITYPYRGALTRSGAGADFLLSQYTNSGILDMGFGSSGTGFVTTDFSGNIDQLVRLARNESTGRVYAVGDSYDGGNTDIVLVRYR